MDDLRRCVPGGTVYLRRPKNPDAFVVAYIDTPAEVDIHKTFGNGTPRWLRVIGPDTEA